MLEICSRRWVRLGELNRLPVRDRYNMEGISVISSVQIEHYIVGVWLVIDIVLIVDICCLCCVTFIYIFNYVSSTCLTSFILQISFMSNLSAPNRLALAINTTSAYLFLLSHSIIVCIFAFK